MKLTNNQKHLELGVAIGFSLIMFLLSTTDIGYIPISEHRSLDMGIIPAVFAAMIGGYRVGIPVAIAWAVSAYLNPASNLQIYTLYGLIVNRLVLVGIAYHSYKVCKKYYEGSPANVYRAIVAAITSKNIVANIVLTYMLEQQGHSFNFREWGLHTVQQYILELALCSLAMALLIKHLRQVHILNGIKRKQRAKKS